MINKFNFKFNNKMIKENKKKNKINYISYRILKWLVNLCFNQKYQKDIL